MSKKIKRVKFTGGDEQYIGGVPARNLDADEWAALSAEKREEAKAVGLYEVEYDDPPPSPKPEPAKASTKE